MTAVAACRKCGTEPLENARFCHGCGLPVVDSETHAEYKQVTVLFADVVHSMAIAAAVGAERLREIMAELANRATVVVQRYGGTLDKFTGDGIMAVFSAPIALGDHAFRACLAALGIQVEVEQLAVDVRQRDGVDLALRVGLNSGQVIAGEIGSGPLGYTAIGEHVGMAERMESVAPPGGVILSESVARLVEHAAVLDEPELVCIKGSEEPVRARRLLAVEVDPGRISRSGIALVGRQWELNTVAGILDRSIKGQGCVVGVAGPAGIGKSRLVDEAAAMARGRGVPVFSTFCESHATDVPFHVVARLLRDATGITDLHDVVARTQVRSQFADATDEDLLLLHDLLGIHDPDVALPNIDPDARRRRLTALINSASVASRDPVLYIIEDAHWIDEVSESMFADFLTVIPQTHSTVLITYRPEYRGALAQMPGGQTISLAPLSDSETGALLGELLGSDPSVTAIGGLVAQRAAGNPFFAQEIVRELAERGVLKGERGNYVSDTDVAEVCVPATLQAAIAARIDRLDLGAKQTLNAAAVIGSRFTPDLLTAVGTDPVVDPLLRAELVDQIRFTPHPEYAFRHPLVRTVAYESQLKSDRAQLHRRLAAAIEQRDPASADENAALVAEHLEAAGDLAAAYAWHMRAAAWSTSRDIVAARMNWERACQVADALPADKPDRLAMRIAPRTMLCGTAWRGKPAPVSDRFEELRELCAQAGDKTSLAIAMTGLVSEHWQYGRMREGAVLASEQIALVDSIGDPALTIGAAFAAVAIKSQAGDMADALRWSQTAIDWADGDAAKGNFVVGSPLAVAHVFRGTARWWLGLDGWRQDLARGVSIARNSDPTTVGFVDAWTYGLAGVHGVLRIDDSVMCALEEALKIAEASGDDHILGTVENTLGHLLTQLADEADRRRGLELLARVREMCLQQRFPLSELTSLNLSLAYGRARGGDVDEAIPAMRECLADLFVRGQFMYLVSGVPLLVEVLLNRAAEGDLAEADAIVEKLTAIPDSDEWVARDIMVLRLRAMLSDARHDEAAYRDHRDRYRAMATSLGFEGHMAWAAAMP